MTAIHKFIKNDVPIVLDIASGAVHAVDKLVYRILDFYPGHCSDYIIDRLKDEYAKKDIIEGLKRLNSWRRKGYCSRRTFTPT